MRWDRPAGTASCAPSRISQGPPPSAREKKGGFEGRAGTGRDARLPRCSVPLRPSLPSAAGRSGCPRILARALPSFVLGSAWLVRPLATFVPLASCMIIQPYKSTVQTESQNH